MINLAKRVESLIFFIIGCKSFERGRGRYVNTSLGVSVRWVKIRQLGEAKRVLKGSELNKKEKLIEYHERIAEEWNALRGCETGNVEEQW